MGGAKGTFLNPRQKRLAVETEDHPLDYIDFEGVIPEGNYGAGTVIVWDTGTYTSEGDIRQQFRDGKISFTIDGKKIKGSFSLIRIRQRQKQWLLIKSGGDPYATSEEEEDLTIIAPESVLTGRTNDELDENKGSGRKKSSGFEGRPSGFHLIIILFRRKTLNFLCQLDRCSQDMLMRHLIIRTGSLR